MANPLRKVNFENISIFIFHLNEDDRKRYIYKLIHHLFRISISTNFWGLWRSLKQVIFVNILLSENASRLNCSNLLHQFLKILVIRLNAEITNSMEFSWNSPHNNFIPRLPGFRINSF